LGRVNHNDNLFQRACRNGHLVVAQWLLSLGGVDIHAYDDEAFGWACHNGHLVVAQWLHGLGGVNTHAANEFAFAAACKGGDLRTGRWLVALEPDWPWPAYGMRALQTCSPARDAWMRAVVSLPIMQ
jgi:hypothetical protein